MKGDYYRYLAEVATGETRNCKLYFKLHNFQTVIIFLLMIYGFI